MLREGSKKGGWKRVNSVKKVQHPNNGIARKEKEKNIRIDIMKEWYYFFKIPVFEVIKFQIEGSSWVPNYKNGSTLKQGTSWQNFKTLETKGVYYRGGKKNQIIH